MTLLQVSGVEFGRSAGSTLLCRFTLSSNTVH